MRRAEEIIRRYPALANLPIAVVNGRVYTLRELVELAKRGVAWAIQKLESAGLDPSPNELKLLAAEFWRRMPRNQMLVVLGPLATYVVSGEEAARQILSNGPLAPLLTDIYLEMLRRVRLGA